MPIREIPELKTLQSLSPPRASTQIPETLSFLTTKPARPVQLLTVGLLATVARANSKQTKERTKPNQICRFFLYIPSTQFLFFPMTTGVGIRQMR